MPFKNKEDQIANRKKYYQANKEKINKAVKDRAEKYPEKFKAERKKAAANYWKKHKVRLKEQRKLTFRKVNLKYLYGLSLEEYNRLLEASNYCCNICSKQLDIVANKNLAVDHCHDTKVVRGILCKSCNLLIGFAYNNIDILEKTIIYLKDTKNGYKI